LKRIVIFGNSGSGKTTLAKQLSEHYQLAHFDLDLIAWLPTDPPERKPLDDSRTSIDQFCSANGSWVIEGCYGDLIDYVCRRAKQMIFINLPVEQCVNNARSRPWEPHKYSSKEAQDSKLEMLVDWIKAYEVREDSFSQRAHQVLFDEFDGRKMMKTSNDHKVDLENL